MFKKLMLLLGCASLLLLVACGGGEEEEYEPADEPDSAIEEYEDYEDEEYEDNEDEDSEDNGDEDSEDNEDEDSEDNGDEETNSDEVDDESNIEAQDLDLNEESHPIVGTWDDLWEDTETNSSSDAQITFDDDGTGIVANAGMDDIEFRWSIYDGILTMAYPPTDDWPFEALDSYEYRIEGDTLVKILLYVADDGEIEELETFYFERAE